MNYKDEIIKIVKSKTNKNFDENTQIRDLGLDSLDMVEMITDFEDKFNLTIPTEKVNGIKTIKDFIEVVESLN